MLLPAAVLWDMDGTLIDSEPYWIAAEYELVSQFGGTWTHADAVKMVGNTLLTSAKFLVAAGVDLPPEEIVDILLDRVVAETIAHIPWRPGARELLTELAANGVPCALVTMSYARFAQVVVDAADGALQLAVVGDEVTNGKPHPEPYLTAAARLSVPIADCVAIEDSPAGIASALAAGARTLGVHNLVDLAPQPGLSRVRLLSELTIGDLGRIGAGEVIDTY